MQKIISRNMSPYIHNTLAQAIPNTNNGTRSDMIYKQTISNPAKYIELSSNPIIAGKDDLKDGLIKVVIGRRGKN